MEKSKQKNSRNESYRFRTGPVFRDMIFLLTLSFAVLLVYAILQINPIAKKSEVERKAEFLIVLEWNKETDDDVDLWIQDPQGRIIYWKDKQAGFIHLAKDDVGWHTDRSQVSGTEKIIYLNREVMTMRGVDPGEYIVNVHLFRNAPPWAPVKGTVRLLKLNPYSEPVVREFTLEDFGDEVTLFRFELDADGEVIDINEDQIRFVSQQGIPVGRVQ